MSLLGNGLINLSFGQLNPVLSLFALSNKDSLELLHKKTYLIKSLSTNTQPIMDVYVWRFINNALYGRIRRLLAIGNFDGPNCAEIVGISGYIGTIMAGPKIFSNGAKYFKYGVEE